MQHLGRKISYGKLNLTDPMIGMWLRSDLEALGLLTKSKIGKEFVWFNTELMDILSAES